MGEWEKAKREKRGEKGNVKKEQRSDMSHRITKDARCVIVFFYYTQVHGKCNDMLNYIFYSQNIDCET